jgi:hypothetical protein
MKILLGLLLSFNAFAAEYSCKKDAGPMASDQIAAVAAGSPAVGPSSFDYPNTDLDVHVWQGRSYAVTDVQDVPNKEDITLNLVKYGDFPVYICEQTPVPYERCFLKSVMTSSASVDDGQEILAFLKKAKLIGNILTVPGVGTNVLHPTISLKDQVGISPQSNLVASAYNVQSTPPRSYVEVGFPNLSTRLQKYYCKNKASNNAVGNGSPNPLSHGIIIDDTADSDSVDGSGTSR